MLTFFSNDQLFNFLQLNYEDDSELAVQLGNRILLIQECDEGYDYYFADLDYKEIDGGIYDNPSVGICYALQDIVSDLEQSNQIVPSQAMCYILDYDEAMEKYEDANELEY